MNYITLLIITAVIVFITDISGFSTTIKKLFLRLFGLPQKDFEWQTIHPLLKIMECSLCQSFWVNNIYLICINAWSLPLLGYVCLLALLTPVIRDFIFIIRDIANTIPLIISKLIEKI